MPKTRLKRVSGLGHLKSLAEDKKSVISLTAPQLKKRQPAAWVINYSGEILYYLFQQGLYVYKTESELIEKCQR